MLYKYSKRREEIQAYPGLGASDRDTSKQLAIRQQLAKRFDTKIDFLLSQGSDHPDYSSSKRPGMAEAKEAAKGFEVDVETVVDIGLDGRLDCPERRKKAERLGKALGAALSA